jgi:hypothetical protein
LAVAVLGLAILAAIQQKETNLLAVAPPKEPRQSKVLLLIPTFFTE